MIGYMPPVHLLLLATFTVPFFLVDRSLFLVFLRWRTYVHPLFVFFVCFLLLIGTYLFGMLQELTFIDNHRDQATGAVPLATFLNFDHQPLFALVLALVTGAVPHGNITLYIGLLPLVFIGYALARTRNTRFLAVSLTAFILVWFSQGGWFAALLYYCIPLMKTYRHLTYVLNMAKLFFLLMGGFGIDQLLTDLEGKTYSPAETRRRPASLLVSLSPYLLISLGFLDILFHLRTIEFGYRNDFAERLDYGDHVFLENPFAHYWLVGRFLIYAGLFGTLLVRLCRNAAAWRFAKRKRTTIGALFCLVYLIDVGFFYALVVKQAPFIKENLTLENEFHVRELRYSSRRTRAMSEIEKRIFKILDSPRGGVQMRGIPYVDWQMLTGSDPLIPQARIQFVSSGVMEMLVARQVEVGWLGFALPKDPLAGPASSARAAGLLGSPLGQGFLLALSALEAEMSSPFLRSLGLASKMHIVHSAVFPAASQAPDVFAELPDPDETLVLPEEEKEPTSAKTANQGGDDVKVTFFSANVVKVAVTADSPGWLFYADAYHPAWKATVASPPGVSRNVNAKVVRANLGFKAVRVPAGTSEVVFYFDDGLRGWLRSVVYFTAVIMGLLLLGGMLVSVVRNSTTDNTDGTDHTDSVISVLSGPSVVEVCDRLHRDLAADGSGNFVPCLMVFCGWVFSFCFGCALWLWIGLDALSLSVLFVSSAGIFAAIAATTPPLPAEKMPGRRLIDLLLLGGLVTWIWQTGRSSLDVSLFLAAIFLGYLLASLTFRCSASFLAKKVRLLFTIIKLRFSRRG